MIRLALPACHCEPLTAIPVIALIFDKFPSVYVHIIAFEIIFILFIDICSH